MTFLPILSQAPSIDMQSTRAYTPADVERLQLLLPQVAHLATQDPQEYALAYTEYYRSDVIALEQEWDFLAAAQMRAWQQAEYAVVIRLTTALAYPAGRRAQLAEAEQVLQLGIEASRALADTQHLASFCNRQGGLIMACGHYSHGQQLWSVGVKMAASIGALPLLWEPLASFAYSADILGDDESTQQFVELLQSTQQHGDPTSLAVALFIRGFFARINNHLDTAYEDLSACLQLLVTIAPNVAIPPFQQFFRTVVQAELARVQGHYARAQAYTETALTIAQVYSDQYTLGTLLIDQMIFTYRMGQFADTRVAFLRLRDIAQRVKTPHFLERSHFFEQRLNENNSSQRTQPTLLNVLHLPMGLHEPLSTREKEVLQLVAAGLTNQEIAQHLVITLSTVKKHLEHIYAKLDAPNRTSAIARARTLNMVS